MAFFVQSRLLILVYQPSSPYDVFGMYIHTLAFRTYSRVGCPLMASWMSRSPSGLANADCLSRLGYVYASALTMIGLAGSIVARPLTTDEMALADPGAKPNTILFLPRGQAARTDLSSTSCAKQTVLRRIIRNC